MCQSTEIKDMIAMINNCITNDKLEFLATLIVNLQTEYQEIAALSTDGEYKTNWTHHQVLDYLTYQNKR